MKDGLTKPNKGTYNQRMIRNALYSESLPPIDISDPEQVQARISEYLDFCVKTNSLPSIVAVSRWIGIHRSTLNDWLHGTPQRMEHHKIIQRFYVLCEEILVARMMDNKISSPIAIFMLKNWFGYSDRVDIGLEAKPDPYSGLNETEIKKRLLDAIPIGGDDLVRDGEDSQSGTSAGEDC